MTVIYRVRCASCGQSEERCVVGEDGTSYRVTHICHSSPAFVWQQR